MRGKCLLFYMSMPAFLTPQPGLNIKEREGEDEHGVDVLG